MNDEANVEPEFGDNVLAIEVPPFLTLLDHRRDGLENAFLIVALVIFWIVRALSHLMPKPEPKPAGPPQEVVLLTDIRDILRDAALPPPELRKP